MKNLPHVLRSGFHYVGNGDKDILKLLFLGCILNQQISCWNVVIQEVTNSKSESLRNTNWISPCKAQGHETIWDCSTVQKQIPCQYGQEIHKLLVKREAATTAVGKLFFYTGWCSKSLTITGEGKNKTFKDPTALRGLLIITCSWSSVVFCLLHRSCPQIFSLSIVSHFRGV